MNFHNRIDQVRPDAPDLARHGPHAVGVRTLTLVDRGRIDVLNVQAGRERPLHDRRLVVEIWYPARPGSLPTPYHGVVLRDGETTATLHGRASRDAEPLETVSPLVILSHGYPGNRFLLSHLAENLAGKGYVVAAIDHAESTYDDQRGFGSTLVNRPLDQIFVLGEVTRLSAARLGFLAGIVDASRTGLVGYSMGGYGAIITAGGGVTEACTTFEGGAPDGTLRIHQAGSATHAALADPRIRAVMAFAPWGMERGFWDADGLKGIRTPVFYVAGSADDVSGYDRGVRALYEHSVNAPRWLLTFEGAGHNVAAPIPAPAESWRHSEKLGWSPFEHYADAVWDSVRMNNVAQHFATAFFDLHLKGDASRGAYLDLVEQAEAGVWKVDGQGRPLPGHSYWKGFGDRTARGLALRRGRP